MNNQQILGKAIQKAIDGGWYPSEKPPEPPDNFQPSYWNEKGVGISQGRNKKRKDGKIERTIHYTIFINNYELIFNHTFAKAIWGEYEPIIHDRHFIPADEFKPAQLGYPDYQHVIPELWHCSNCGEHIKETFDRRCLLLEEGNVGFEYHLKQMVLSPNPIKYLEEHLDDQ